ncbi:MAG: hypothetical protein JJ957_12960 [Pseudomonadales bacterium]|nr:hypothetical protein [Pseudomonadales bacterium]MBO6563718.1 hypothetical protein [Pseudomonadales bacterium]MBO6596776.1 hypothetical protein [Pseudomonadales bacterium]MBO6823235.1 hypothetical protein [Pseudomonadales bacterium]
MTLKTAGAILLMSATAVSYWFICPCGVIPGGPLFGERVTEPVEDWSFVNDKAAVPLCQIEVDFPIPRAMNVNCMSTGGDLFVSCSGCADKQWAARALAHPNGIVQAAGKVYPITYERVTDEAKLDRIWAARLSKIGKDLSARPDHWWSFGLIQKSG